MNDFERVMRGIRRVLDTRTSYEVAKALNVPNRTINRYQNGTTPLENMTIGTAQKIFNYHLKEMNEMKVWEFKGYTVYEESEVLKFEDKEGNLLGYVSNIHEYNLIDELDNGADPIADGWEDGVGNIIGMDGWGER